MALQQPLMTANELHRMPDDDWRYELVRGALIRMSPAGARHGVIGIRLAALLLAHVDARDLGVVVGTDTGFVLARDPDTVRAPDVAYVHRDRIPAAGVPAGFWPLAPDLAAEIVSPSERPAEVAAKVTDYLAAGTRLVWVLRPEVRTVEVHGPDRRARTLTTGDVLDAGDVVPGFHAPVADLL